jgi:hypothetical protein
MPGGGASGKEKGGKQQVEKERQSGYVSHLDPVII